MRRVLPLGALLMGIGWGAAARPAEAQLEGVGVIVGPSFSSFRGNGSSSFKSKTGFMAGGFVKLNLGGPVGLRPEVFYVQKGAKTNTTPQST